MLAQVHAQYCPHLPARCGIYDRNQSLGLDGDPVKIRFTTGQAGTEGRALVPRIRCAAVANPTQRDITGAIEVKRYKSTVNPLPTPASSASLLLLHRTSRTFYHQAGSTFLIIYTDYRHSFIFRLHSFPSNKIKTLFNMVANTFVPFVGGAIAKRFADEPEAIQLPWWSSLVGLANILVFLVPILWVSIP